MHVCSAVFRCFPPPCDSMPFFTFSMFFLSHSYTRFNRLPPRSFVLIVPWRGGRHFPSHPWWMSQRPRSEYGLDCFRQVLYRTRYTFAPVHFRRAIPGRAPLGNWCKIRRSLFRTQPMLVAQQIIRSSDSVRSTLLACHPHEGPSVVQIGGSETEQLVAGLCGACLVGPPTFSRTLS